MPWDRTAHVWELQAADFITCTNTSAKHKLIRYSTGVGTGYEGHAMLYMGAGTIVEACMPVVHKTSISHALEEDPWAKAWRVTGLSAAQRFVVCKTAENMCGTPYDLTAAARSAVPAFPKSDGPQCYFCSGIVVAAYEAAGVQLTNGEVGRANPGKLANFNTRSPLVHWLGWLKHPDRGDCDKMLLYPTV